MASSLASDDTFHFENSFLPPTGHVNNGKKDEIIPCFSGKGVSYYFSLFFVCTICFLRLVTSSSVLDAVANSTLLPMTMATWKNGGSQHFYNNW